MLSMTIGGEPVESAETFGVVNPATGEVFAQAPVCSPAQLDQAMAAAQAAYASWRTDEDARVSAMLKLAEIIPAAADELGALLAQESGKPLELAGMEPGICGVWLQHYAAMDIPREVVQDDDIALIEVARRPLGVVAAITPWNFPLGLAMWKIAPALRAGNTIVLKPSPFTPLATLRLAQIMNEVLPAGVFNVVTGGDDLGAAMTAHPTPRKVTFTGSVAAGKKVAISSAADLKRITLELGGNDAAILLDDVDVSSIAPVVVGTAFFNTGQACALPKRIYAPASRYEEVVEAFAGVASAMNGTMGPLSTKPQLERVRELVDDAIDHGVRAVTGGHAVDGPGYFFEPTILADAKDGTRIVDEEQFGPALPIIAYDNVEDAVARANASMYGLCGSVWSTDAGRAQNVAEQLECGTTFVNTHAQLPPNSPFGGAKWSGLGVENGVPGLLSFTEAQTVYCARA